MVRRAAFLAVLLLSLAGCGVDAPPEDLRKLVRPNSPNSYLICPPGLCAATADEDGFSVDRRPEIVLAAAHRAAVAQPNTETTTVDAVMGQLIFIQRTRWLRFPDIVRIQVIKDKDGHSALALYSQSVYGHYDFGANKARAQTWLKAIQAELAKN